ncbi:MAG: hypothetical protein V4675_04180 [Verrucomicrobiota bacterium]
MLSVLATTSKLLERSTEAGWDLRDPKELKAEVDQIIDSIFYGESAGLPENWNILFAPTGLLQEASMANGWAEIFLKLAEGFDSLEPVVKQFEAEHSARGHRGHD